MHIVITGFHIFSPKTNKRANISPRGRIFYVPITTFYDLEKVISFEY